MNQESHQKDDTESDINLSEAAMSTFIGNYDTNKQWVLSYIAKTKFKQKK